MLREDAPPHIVDFMGDAGTAAHGAGFDVGVQTNLVRYAGVAPVAQLRARRNRASTPCLDTGWSVTACTAVKTVLQIMSSIHLAGTIESSNEPDADLA